MFEGTNAFLNVIVVYLFFLYYVYSLQIWTHNSWRQELLKNKKNICNFNLKNSLKNVLNKTFILSSNNF